jgi:hypothetical protein
LFLTLQLHLGLRHLLRLQELQGVQTDLRVYQFVVTHAFEVRHQGVVKDLSGFLGELLLR